MGVGPALVPLMPVGLKSSSRDVSGRGRPAPGGHSLELLVSARTGPPSTARPPRSVSAAWAPPAAQGAGDPASDQGQLGQRGAAYHHAEDAEGQAGRQCRDAEKQQPGEDPDSPPL